MRQNVFADLEPPRTHAKKEEEVKPLERNPCGNPDSFIKLALYLNKTVQLHRNQYFVFFFSGRNNNRCLVKFPDFSFAVVGRCAIVDGIWVL